ncbi:MAG: polysaccharide deacetylase family protein [Dehalococcoidia bacterium]|jgi:peptidoglycan/xylan/chitin deacetylase (PgdA/CDA1 family)
MVKLRLLAALSALTLGLVALAFVACNRGSPATLSPTVAPLATDTPVEESEATSPPMPVPETPAPPPPSAECDHPAFQVQRGNSTRQMVALTFDAGADAGNTTQVLQILAANGIKASFSLTGEWSQANPGLVKAIASAGHLIMNHTQDHPSFTGLSTGQGPLSTQDRIAELDEADLAIRSITGKTTKPYFRPPYGDVDGSVLCDASSDGYNYVVMWTVDTLGWNGASVDQIVQKSLSNAKPGAIYIMHVGSESQDATALQQVIDGLKAKGYSFGTVADVIR